ncbi:MAG: hypothetical protein QOG00_1349 [Pyrinomonadaceae bacterium]|nr:hypothetical protein [Pyrinomonadaceae bacterium]
MLTAMRKAEQPKKSEEFTRFEQTLRNLMAVPKSEIDKEKAKYERQREKDGKRKRPAK